MTTTEKKSLISVIEHDEVFGTVLKTIFGDEGYTVDLRLFPIEETVTMKPDLLIFDVSPYHLDEQRRVLSSLCKGRNMPIILMSTSRANMHKAIGECEVVAELEKPIDMDKLLDLVRSSLN